MEKDWECLPLLIFPMKIESHKSSLGFYVTGRTYNGDAGFSLKLYGDERNYNSNAYKRGIVIHTADYMMMDFFQKMDAMGAAWDVQYSLLTSTNR